MHRKSIFSLTVLLFFVSPSGFAQSPAETLLRASRPDVKLRFRYCVPTTAEAEINYTSDLSAAGSLSQELIKLIPAGPNRERIALELRNSEAKFIDDLAKAIASAVSDLAPDDLLFRYAFDDGENVEAGLLVVRNNAIRKKIYPHFVPSLFPYNRFSSLPENPETLLHELCALVHVSGIISQDGKFSAIVMGKKSSLGDSVSVEYARKNWVLEITGIQSDSVTLKLGAISETIKTK